MSFKLDVFWPFGSFQCTEAGSDPALIKANGSFAINLMGVGKNLSQALPIQAMDCFVQLEVFALVALFLTSLFFSLLFVFQVYLDTLTKLCSAVYKQVL